MSYRRMIALVLMIILLLLGCGQTQEPENPYRLKTQTVERYRQSNVQAVTIEYSYDENNRVIQTQAYYDDHWHSTTQYTRDEYGNIICTWQSFADGTENLVEETLTLDDQNRILRSEGTSDDGRTTVCEYSYNQRGQVTKQYIHRHEIGEGLDINSFTDSTYDRKGRLVRQEVRWEPPNSNDGYSVYTYKQDKLVREETYIGDELVSYVDYTYNETGMIQTAVMYKADGTQETKHITTFDEFGNKLEVVSYAYYHDLVVNGETDEEPDSKTTYIYEQREEN